MRLRILLAAKLGLIIFKLKFLSLFYAENNLQIANQNPNNEINFQT